MLRYLGKTLIFVSLKKNPHSVVEMLSLFGLSYNMSHKSLKINIIVHSC